ncbi:hypothetical protein Halhy_3870 [Haliscomenobacter hydrossis DSM 1100]|uniref:Helix-turn-helix type 11 domain-containing protein n=1 Tax=Haliscomenobacter hydrossis (strain ATCC 27775 / DSM 1100 / LMG 10767 / O) TaxID=760192 RepID=F4L387_HALH1|nr:hypothetical protein Halhy_3870 [Haliscomenobacter hydrossis DSM 1100]
MKLSEQLQLLDRLNDLILRKGTGNYLSLSTRLAVSPRQVYYLLDALEDLGAEIAYCKIRQSYYYVNEGGLDFSGLVLSSKNGS